MSKQKLKPPNKGNHGPKLAGELNNPKYSMEKAANKAGPGRPKGSPNKVTADARACMTLVAQGFSQEVLQLLRRGAKKDPLGAVRTFAQLLEFHIPKLSRTEVTGAQGGPMQITRVYFGKAPPDAKRHDS